MSTSTCHFEVYLPLAGARPSVAAITVAEIEREVVALLARYGYGPDSTSGVELLRAEQLRDDHSASRRVDVLEREAPHLLAREPGNRDA